MIYQWQKDGVDLTGGSNINGSTTATLTITSARVSDSGSYIVQVVNAAGIATSDEVILTVNALTLESIAIITPPTRTTYFTGEALDLTGLVVTGTYSDGSTVQLPITMENISGFDSSTPASSQVITVTYEGKTATFTVDIEAAPLPVMSGMVTISGTAKYGEILTADTTGITYTPNTDDDVPTYQWKRNDINIDGATNPTYTLTQSDIDSRISVTLTADGVHAIGSVTSTPTAVVEKADEPAAPPAPVMVNKTHNSVTLEPNEAYEFRVNGGAWQDSNVFTGLSPQTQYTFTARVKETATHKASAESMELIVTTNVLPNSGGNTGSGTGTSTRTTQTIYEANVSGRDTAATTLPVSVNTNLGSATVDLGSLAEDIFSNTGTTSLVIPPIPGVNSYALEIPASALSGSQEKGTLTLSTGVGNITIPAGMLAGIPGIEGSKAGITIGIGDKTNLPEEVKTAIGERPVVQLTLTLDGKQTEWNNPNAPVTVSIPYTPTSSTLPAP